MSRSGYSDDMDDLWRHIMWRGAVNSAIRGKRGQRALREILAALDAMPEKRLTSMELEADGEFCTLGVLGQARGVDMQSVDPTDSDAVAELFGLAPAMVREIVYENDETISEDSHIEELHGPLPSGSWHTRLCRRVPDERAAEKRWIHMRRWIASQIKEGGAA